MEIIAIGLSPNTEPDDVTQALKIFFMPWRWHGNDARSHVIDWFRNYFSTNNITLFSSGRSALTALLDSFGIGAGDEVIIQAFTCMVVPNAIRFIGAVPIYADVDSSANIDPKDMERKITPRTKAIVVQHTFGTPADMDAIMKIARNHHILVIEDCAHALGASYKGKKIGSIGDGAIFSFGRDKVISSVFGGASIVNDKWPMINDILKQTEKKSLQPSVFWIIQQLLHPIAMNLILPLYSSGIGKIILVLLQKLHVLSFPVSKSELSGTRPRNYIMRYPNALAYILMRQLQKLDRYTKIRQGISEYYKRELKKLHIAHLEDREQSARLRFGIVTPNQKHILQRAKQNNILLGNWYHDVVHPNGLCPKADQLAKTIVNLPTRITQKQAERIIRVIGSL